MLAKFQSIPLKTVETQFEPVCWNLRPTQRYVINGVSATSPCGEVNFVRRLPTSDFVQKSILNIFVRKTVAHFGTVSGLL